MSNETLIIVEDDCGTKRGITVTSLAEGGDVVAPLVTRILGRTATEDIIHPNKGEVLVKAGTVIVEEDCVAIEEAEMEQILVRSVLTCESIKGVCGACYGRDLARGTQVNIGLYVINSSTSIKYY